jgi:apolipoprotein N-acyltransferase
VAVAEAVRVEAGPKESAAHQWRRLVAGLALASLSALLATWAFPPYGWWFLIWVAWAPMVVAQQRVLPARWSGLAPAVGIGGFYAGYLHGLFDASFAWWMALIPVVVAVGVFFATARWRWFDEATRYRLFVIGFPLAWVAVDFLRGFVPAVATRGYPAYALFREPWLLQPVSVVSIHVLNLLILMVNWAIAGVVLLALSRPGPLRLPASKRTVLGGAAVVALAGVAWLAASLSLLGPTRPVVRVAAIQPGTTVVSSLQMRMSDSLVQQGDAEELRRKIDQSRAAAAAGAKLIVWPEKTLSFDPQREHTAELQALARETGAYLVVGYGVVTPRGQRNEATVIDPEGRFLGVYGKQHPAIMFSEERTSIIRSGIPVYRTAIGRLGTIICYDLDFTGTARAAARHGAQIVAVPSWDPKGDATKHYDLLVLRAIENRLTMIKADAAYASAVIDPYGRLLGRVVTRHGAPAVLVRDVPLGSGDAPLVRLGDWPGWTLVLASAGLIFMGTRTVARRGRHRRRPG